MARQETTQKYHNLYKWFIRPLKKLTAIGTPLHYTLKDAFNQEKDMEILVQNLLHLAGLKETFPKDLRVYIAEEISKVSHFTPQNYQRDEHIIGQMTRLQKADFKERNT